MSLLCKRSFACFEYTRLFFLSFFFFFFGTQNTTFASTLCAAFFQAVRNLVYVGGAAEKRDLLPRGSYFQCRWSLQMPGRRSMNLSFSRLHVLRAYFCFYRFRE